MLRWTLLAVFATSIALLLACAQQAGKHMKPGVSEETRKADVLDCAKSTMNLYPPEQPGGGTAYGVEAGIAKGIVDGDRIGGYRKRKYNECMAKRGYKRQPAL
ncbi:MAG TPA: hypothetical protein VGF29_09380 [Hyphomicrobiaceae bacterium]|jgi:hypothetical protein